MKKDRRWIYIAVMSLFMAIVWVAASLIIKQRQSTIPADLQQIITPLDPSIDQTIFTRLAGRQKIINL